MRFPVTPDGRYFMIRGRLWRISNPALGANRHEAVVRELMLARRAVGEARNTGDGVAGAAAKAAVDKAKRALGERGAMWWSDGARDLTPTSRAPRPLPNGQRRRSNPVSGGRPTRPRSGR